MLQIIQYVTSRCHRSFFDARDFHLHLEKRLLARADATASAILFDFLEPDHDVVADVEQKAPPARLEVDARKVVKHFRRLVHDLVKNYHGARSRSQNMM